MNLEKIGKKELIAIINDQKGHVETVERLYEERKNELDKFKRIAIDNDRLIHDLRNKIKIVKRGAQMEVASTMRTARFLIDSFSFDTFTHRQKANLASRYSVMLKTKEEKLINSQIDDELMPF